MDADETMQAYVEAWGRGSPEDAFDFFADDVVMRLPGRGRLATSPPRAEQGVEPPLMQG